MIAEDPVPMIEMLSGSQAVILMFDDWLSGFALKFAGRVCILPLHNMQDSVSHQSPHPSWQEVEDTEVPLLCHPGHIVYLSLGSTGTVSHFLHFLFCSLPCLIYIAFTPIYFVHLLWPSGSFRLIITWLSFYCALFSFDLYMEFVAQAISLFGFIVYSIDHRMGNKLEHIWGFVNDYPFYYLCGKFKAVWLFFI